MVVSEAGASVYSASKLAAAEYPEYDLTLRSAVSIAHRLQDPLAELVKIDPKAIGVGQYQHDMPAKRLDEALGGVVEACVNAVGVDLNTASPSLLENHRWHFLRRGEEHRRVSAGKRRVHNAHADQKSAEARAKSV